MPTKYAKTKKVARLKYRANQLENIIWTQAHKLGRQVIENEIARGRRTKGCEFIIKTDIDPLSTDEMIMEIRCNIQEIQVNHSDGSHLNNESTKSNPTLLETPCSI